MNSALAFSLFWIFLKSASCSSPGFFYNSSAKGGYFDSLIVGWKNLSIESLRDPIILLEEGTHNIMNETLEFWSKGNSLTMKAEKEEAIIKMCHSIFLFQDVEKIEFTNIKFSLCEQKETTSMTSININNFSDYIMVNCSVEGFLGNSIRLMNITNGAKVQVSKFNLTMANFNVLCIFCFQQIKNLLMRELSLTDNGFEQGSFIEALKISIISLANFFLAASVFRGPSLYFSEVKENFSLVNLTIQRSSFKGGFLFLLKNDGAKLRESIFKEIIVKSTLAENTFIRWENVYYCAIENSLVSDSSFSKFFDGPEIEFFNISSLSWGGNIFTGVVLNLQSTIVIGCNFKIVNNTFQNASKLIQYPPNFLQTAINMNLSNITASQNRITGTSSLFVFSYDVLAPEQSLILFSNCEFFQNFGGFPEELRQVNRFSILFIINVPGSFKLRKVNFIENKIEEYGGNPCLAFSNLKIIVYFENSIFHGNSAYRYSNIFTFFGLSLKLLNCSLINNIKMFPSSTTSGIILEGLEALFDGCIVQGNHADYGNALLLLRSSNFAKTILSFDNCNIAMNYGVTATFVILQVYHLEFNMRKSFIKENQGQSNGGFVYGYYFPSDARRFLYFWENCVFFNNSANNGGVIFINAMYAHYLILNCTFESNRARNLGGVLFYYTDFVGTSQFFFKFCKFKKNTAKSAAAIANMLGVLKDLGSIFEDNEATTASTIMGSAISWIYLNDSKIIRAKANKSHNLMILNVVTLTAINIVFEGCQSKLISSGITVHSFATVLVINSSFINNQGASGVVIFSKFCNNSIVLVNCSIIKNIAQFSLILLKVSKAILHNLKILNNTGAIFDLTNTELDGINLTIIRNDCNNIFKGCLLYEREQSFVYFFNFSIEATMTATFSSNLIQTDYSELQLLRGRIEESDFASVYILKYFNIINSIMSIAEALIRNPSPKYIFAEEGQLILRKTNFSFERKSSLKTSALYASKILLSIEECVFENFKEGAVFIKGPFARVLIYLTSFDFNRGSEGAALNLFNLNLTINYSFFSNNTAEKNGGAIRNFCDSIHWKCEGIINSSVFTNNRAESGAGGAIYWENTPLMETNCSYSNNSAIYGDDIASQAIYLVVEDYEAEHPLAEFLSGSKITALSFSHKDYYNQTVLTLENIKGSLSLVVEENGKAGNENLNTGVKGTTSATSVNGKLDFKDITLKATPATKCWILVDSEIYSNPMTALLLKQSLLIKNSQMNYAFDGSPKLWIEVNFIMCVRGQVYVAWKNVCEFCPPGSFSLNPQEVDCRVCPENAFCPGGDTIEVFPGYWRKSVDSSNVYKCKKKSACLGGNSSNICQSGYYGNLCDSCQNEKGLNYFQDIDGKCKNCSSTEYIKTTIMICIILIVLIVYVVYLIRCKLSRRNPLSSLLFKVLNHHLQMFFLAMTLQLNALSDIKDAIIVPRGIGKPSSIINGFECFENSIAEDFSFFYKKMFFGCLVTFALPLIVAIIWKALFLFMKKYRMNPRSYDMRANINTSLIIIFYTFQPSFINDFVDGIACVEIEGQEYNTLFLQEKCWDSSHMKLAYVLIIPMLILWMLLVPAFINIQLLRRIKKKLNLESYSYVLIGLKIEYFYWDFIYMAEKYIFITISLFITDPVLMSFFFLFVSYFYFILELRFQPYQYPEFNQLVTCSHMAIHFTISAGAFSNLTKNSIFNYAVIAAAFLTNLLFFWTWVKLFVKRHGRINKFLRTVSSKIDDLVSPQRRKTKSNKKKLFSSSENVASNITIENI